MFGLIRWTSGILQITARVCSFALLLMVFVQLSVVLLRYVFDSGFLWLQESVVYLHVCSALFGIGYTLYKDAHVRVDIFYRRASRPLKVIVNLVGLAVFVLPFCIALWITSWPFVAASWSALEGSNQPSGIQAVFLLKSGLLAASFLTMVGAVALALKQRARIVEPTCVSK
ncbi:TRAP-type mannitol/chloroaromatic compound transport system permease small subunit [Roseibium hamelinense]|uniref:TRAP transporter small permease protein n=1 Tax=Roseibium hamelinense TaxID=150831 RepID=A0A562SNQ5_9HYPH|nr:TRAP transporter small permease subunit [Roseibium hamelinense]MTI45056.1 TRAP transporter small permease subunit [Roseibium hamelinense]TWI82320.1 TRAP-type mannitol/chloroaromatic compound transport system permease small subunit [Roseibium hamelinense]